MEFATISLHQSTIPDLPASDEQRLYPIAHVEKLERDVKSRDARVRVFQQALNGQIEASPIGFVKGTASVAPILKIARLVEEQGKLPLVAFARDKAGIITGITLSLALTKAEHAATPAVEIDPCPKGDYDCETGDDGSCHDACEAPRRIGMGVVEDSEDVELIVPRGVLT